jgi:ArsR family transcriptional regulator
MTKKLNAIKNFIPCCVEEFTEEDRNLVVTVSKALGNEARLEIYSYLRMMNSCVTGTLVEHLPLAQSTISQHLKVLKSAGVIAGTIEGTSTSYCINRERMKRYYKLIGQMI